MSEKVRYSDAELKEFRAILDEKIADAQSDLKHFQSQIDHTGDEGGSNDGTFDMMEDGSESLSREKLSQLAHRQRKFIQQLKAALVRIENKTYGVCRVTGKLIAKERLKIVPHTTLSIEAKNAEND
jgi:RNA polymerase-binding transcription factor DksA